MLKSKRILFIAPEYFNYYILIKHSLESEGAYVDLFYNRPTSKLSKFFFVFNQWIYKKINQCYFRRLLQGASQDYDYILIIRADLVPVDFIKKLRNKYSGAKFIQYIWDDISLFPKLLDSFQIFDRILSYEPGDCNKYGLIFRPFFFVIQYKTNDCTHQYVYDMFFIGSFHTDRLQVLENVKKLNPQINCYMHFYINPVTFLLNKAIWSKRSFFRFRKMKYAEMIGTMKNSRAILDIQNISQNGLTTRIFEALGSRSKIITTNMNILDYEFYNGNNIYLIDRNNPLIENSWLNLPYEDYDTELINKYHIKSWINEVFDI